MALMSLHPLCEGRCPGEPRVEVKCGEIHGHAEPHLTCFLNCGAPLHPSVHLSVRPSIHASIRPSVHSYPQGTQSPCSEPVPLCKLRCLLTPTLSTHCTIFVVSNCLPTQLVLSHGQGHGRLFQQLVSCHGQGRGKVHVLVFSQVQVLWPSVTDSTNGTGALCLDGQGRRTRIPQKDTGQP